MEPLEYAKHLVKQRSHLEGSEQDALWAIACGLIALAERLDGVIDMNDGAFKILSRDDSREE